MDNVLTTGVRKGLNQSTPTDPSDSAPSGALVFPDKVKLRMSAHVGSDVLSRLDRYQVVVDEDGAVVRESGFDRNLYVADYASGSLVSGSLRNWAVAGGLVSVAEPFGPEAFGAVLHGLAARYGLPEATVSEAWLSFLEVACDVRVERPVREYVGALGDLPRATTHRHGETTARFETSRLDLVSYRKDDRLLRIEVRVKSPADVFGRRLVAGDLTDPQFRTDLARFWVRHARRLPFRRTCRADRRPTTYRDRVRRYALLGMTEAGGLDGAVADVRADRDAGRITASQAQGQIRNLRALWADADLTGETDLAAEVARAIDAVEASITAPVATTNP